MPAPSGVLSANTVVLVLSVATFLVAAKTHGRQVRLERERAGYTQVVFGGSNPEFVEALWKRDRIRFWSTAAVVLVLLVALRLAGASLGIARPLGGNALGTGWMLLFLPLLTGFLMCGVASLVGFLSERAGEPGFTAAALPGSLGWWALLLTLVGLTVTLAFRRPGS
jgi:uncharacterized membrane protein (DUF485 family)